MSKLEFGQQLQSDTEICAEEVKAIAQEMSNKRAIIQAAAEKLAMSGKYDKDQTVIASRIHKLFTVKTKGNARTAIFHRSYIHMCLPSEFKREYAKHDKDIAKDLFEEALFIIADTAEDVKRIAMDLVRKTRKDQTLKEEAHEALMESMHELHGYYEDNLKPLARQMSKIRQLRDLVEHLKSCQLDIDYIKELTDDRQKLTPFMKLRIKMLLFTNSFAHLAKKLGYSSKWLSAISRDPQLDELISKFGRCPKCAFSFEDWFAKARIAEEKGIEIPPIHDDGNGANKSH